MKPLLNVVAKALKTAFLASGGTLIALMAGAADKLLQGEHKSPAEMIAFAIAAGAITGLIAGLKRYLGYKPELDPYVNRR